MIANLYIQTCLRKDSTQLGNCYFSPPFKVMNITENKTAKQLHLMLMSSSPGVLDGDNYTMKIEVEAGSALQLHTQGYQRIFNMKTQAQQTFEVHFQEDASFVYLPHPSVPHENSNFTSRNKIYLEENSTLIWGEVLTCGRKLNGEVFQFNKYHNITEIFLKNRLLIKENLLMQPSLNNVQSLGLLEGYTHQASLIHVCPNSISESQIDSIQDFLSKQENINFGITSIAPNNLIVRILGFKAEQLHDCLKEMATTIFSCSEIPNNFSVYTVNQ